MAMPQQLLFSQKSIYGFIRSYIDKRRVNSTNTADAYENDIRQFFYAMKGKDIEKLVVEDLIFTNQEIEEYQMSIIDFAPATIARKITSVKRLYNKLEANNYPVKEAWFNVDKVKGSSKSHGDLSWSEVLDMIEIVKKELKGDIKAVLLETAVITCFRQKSLLSLTWDDLEKKDGVWVLVAQGDAVGKGKKESIKPINDELYEKIIKLKSVYNDNRIFPLQKKTVVLMMQRLRKVLELEDDVVFHSLKNCGINEAFEITGGNIMAVAEQGDHESFGTTMKHYMKKKKKYSDMVGLKIGQPVDVSPLKDLSHEELLNLVEGASRTVQLELLHALKK